MNLSNEAKPTLVFKRFWFVEQCKKSAPVPDKTSEPKSGIKFEVAG
jgi:hypothetical protein